MLIILLRCKRVTKMVLSTIKAIFVSATILAIGAIFLTQLVIIITHNCKGGIQVNRSVSINVMFVRNGFYKDSDYWLIVAHINDDELTRMLQNGTVEIDIYGRISMVKVDVEVIEVIRHRLAQELKGVNVK